MNQGQRVTAIIVNWNAGAQLRTCLNSIHRHGGNHVRDVVVVDNGSTDGSDSGLGTEAGVTLIRAKTNLGFATACNLGAQNATGEYLLFLNPDAALHESTLSLALDFMSDSANSKVGICGVQLLDEAGHVARSCARFPSAFSLVLQAIGIDRVIPKLGYFMVNWDHRQNRQVDQVIGAFFLVRRELFEALQGFDERFFVYFEDLDFSLRARQAGWLSIYLADAQAFHAGGGTSKQIKARRLFYILRSRILYAAKHFSVLGCMVVALATVLIEPCSRVVWAIGRLSWAGLKETGLAYGMLLRWLPAWFVRKKTR